MSSQLFKAILAMDSYNRSYNQGIEGINGNFLGDAEIITDSAIFGDVQNSNPGVRKDVNIGFYAIAYKHQGEVIISYRGTDDGLLSKDFLHGFGVGTGTANAEQGIMAANLYRTAPCLH